jgi:4-amino-4-deoxy-L-arabinose transferase-like glycosyltransferase
LLLSACALGFALRLGYVLGLSERSYDPDEKMYLAVARNLAGGKGLIYSPWRRASFPPLYPIFLAVFVRGGIFSFRVARVAQVFLGAFSCGLLGLAARSAFAGRSGAGTREGSVAAFLAAGDPLLIYYSGRLMTETLFIFLLLAAAALLLGAAEAGFTGRRLPAAGALLGMGILCRPTLVILAAACLLWPPLRGRGYVRRALRFLFPLLLVLLPWTARNFLVLGEFVPLNTQGGNNFYLANNPHSSGGTVRVNDLIALGAFHLGETEDEIAYSRGYGKKAMDFIRSDPARFLRLSFRRLAWLYHLDAHNPSLPLAASLWVALLLGVTGAILSRGWEGKASLFLLGILSFTLIHSVFLPEGRYRLPVMPFVYAFAAVALSGLVRPGQEDHLRKPGTQE